VRSLLFAANWKMNLGPSDARSYLATFLKAYAAQPNRQVWFFPPAVSLEAVAMDSGIGLTFSPACRTSTGSRKARSPERSPHR